MFQLPPSPPASDVPLRCCLLVFSASLFILHVFYQFFYLLTLGYLLPDDSKTHLFLFYFCSCFCHYLSYASCFIFFPLVLPFSLCLFSSLVSFLIPSFTPSLSCPNLTVSFLHLSLLPFCLFSFISLSHLRHTSAYPQPCHDPIIS